MNKQQKIHQIIALAKGKITPAEIGPKMVINFNTPEGDIHLIDGQRVDKETFDKTLEPFIPLGGRFTTTGRPGDDGPTPDEYYLG